MNYLFIALNKAQMRRDWIERIFTAINRNKLVFLACCIAVGLLVTSDGLL